MNVAVRVRRLIKLCFSKRTLAIALLVGCSSAKAGESPLSPLPGGTPEDADLAINHPDDYAWKLFLGINRQAAAGKPGEPDPGKTITQYDDDKPVVWESWALASGGRNGGAIINPDALPNEPHPNYSEVFLNDGAQPLAWGLWPRAPETKRFERLPAEQLDAVRQSLRLESITPSAALQRLRPTFVPVLAQAEGDEVRMNRATYEFVRDKSLYSVEGLEAQFKAEVGGQPPLSFPVASQEIKAQWRKITDADKPRYHWRSLSDPSGTIIYGLVALHIISKDLPQWFWSDFVHKDFDGSSEAAAVDSSAKNADGSHVGTENSKWAQYRLRGSQTSFTDSLGRSTIVANPLIEGGFQQTSSCITCHSRATVGLRAAETPTRFRRLTTFPLSGLARPQAVGAIGTPDFRWYLDANGAVQYVQTDFLWSLPFRVLKKPAGTP
jgi:hypothetical protein